jgi:WD40 repeat protein
MDIADNVIVTGSWRPDNVLETWDFGTGKLIEGIEWNQSSFRGSEPCMLYAAQFSKGTSNNRFIAAGGSGANEAKIFDRQNSNKLIGSITGLSRGVFTLDFSAANDRNLVAIAGGDGAIRIIELSSSGEDKEEDKTGGSGNVIDLSKEAKAPEPPPAESKVLSHFANAEEKK